MSDDIINPPVTRDTRVIVGDRREVKHEATVVRTNAEALEDSKRDAYALAVTDAAARSIVGTLDAIYEQNERILMLLESIAE